ncbi:tannase and feruloyl esterase, partial [Aspergillus sclerotiicarbonarius CBS 121057]
MALLSIARVLLIATALLGHVSASKGCVTDTFRSLGLSNINILSLNVTAARNYPTSDSKSSGATSASTGRVPSTVDICFVSLQYTHPGQNDVVNTYIGLPLNASNWNTRFLMDGGGGWTAGGLDEIIAPAASGYSSSSTDGAHNSTTSTVDWGFVSEGNTNWPALWDFSSVALGEAATLGKMATEIYFGSSPKYSYWNGCSTGGRQGHMMAQRFPTYFDGIVAGSPAINWDRFQLAEYWPTFLAQLLDTQPPACVLDAFTDAAIEACDLLDGVKDEIISLPGQCHFKASSIVGQIVNCSDPDGQITITDSMAELVRGMWEGPISLEDQFEWYGLNYDADLTSLLATTCTSLRNCTVTPFSISADWARIFLARNSSFSVQGLTRQDFDDLFRESVDQYASIIGTHNPDLTSLKLAGGKMIAWHGMQDELIPTNGTVDYYSRVMGRDRNVADYYRFFLAPGVAHCGGGPGFDPSDTVFETLRAWVENGTVPDTLGAIATAVAGSNSSSTRTADLCPYPKVFTFVGGNPNDAASFGC